MLKQLNRVLKLVGLNLVRAKRKSVKWQKLPPHTREELENAPLKCAVNQPGAAPLSDYMGDAEWHDTGKTHYVVGDGCEPAHPEWETAGGTTPEQNEARFERPRVEQPNSDNKISGPTS